MKGQKSIILSKKEFPKDSIAQQLTDKELIFCQVYVHTGANKTAAASAAGYSDCHIYASAMNVLKRPKIKQFIKELTEQKLEEMGFSREGVIAELLPILRSDIADFVDWGTHVVQEDDKIYEEEYLGIRSAENINMRILCDNEGNKILNEDGNPITYNTHNTKVIKKIKRNKEGNIELELWDKLNAASKISDLLGVSSKFEVTGAEGGPVKVDNLANDLIAKLNKFSNVKKEEAKSPESDESTSSEG